MCRRRDEAEQSDKARVQERISTLEDMLAAAEKRADQLCEHNTRAVEELSVGHQGREKELHAALREARGREEELQAAVKQAQEQKKEMQRVVSEAHRRAERLAEEVKRESDRAVTELEERLEEATRESVRLGEERQRAVRELQEQFEEIQGENERLEQEMQRDGRERVGIEEAEETARREKQAIVEELRAVRPRRGVAVTPLP